MHKCTVDCTWTTHHMLWPFNSSTLKKMQCFWKQIFNEKNLAQSHHLVSVKWWLELDIKCMVKKFIFPNWVAHFIFAIYFAHLNLASQPIVDSLLSCNLNKIFTPQLPPGVTAQLGTGLNISLWQYWDICSHFYTSVTVAATSTFLSSCQDTFEDTAKTYLFQTRQNIVYELNMKGVNVTTKTLNPKY